MFKQIFLLEGPSGVIRNKTIKDKLETTHGQVDGSPNMVRNCNHFTFQF